MKTAFVSLTNLMDVQIAQSILSSDGIESVILDENISCIAPHYILAIGGVRLVVSEDDAPRSDEIIRDYIDKTDLTDRKKVVNRKNLFRCPSCSGQNISFAWFPWIFQP